MENQVEEWVVTMYYYRSEHYYSFRVPNAELDTFLEKVDANENCAEPTVSPLNPISDFATGLELG